MVIRRWTLMMIGFAVLLTSMMLMIHQSLSALSTQREAIEGLKAELTIEREKVKSLQVLLKGLSEAIPPPPTPSCPAISPSQPHNRTSSSSSSISPSSATVKVSYDLSLDPWKFTNQGIFDDRLALHPLIKNFRNRSFDWHKLTPPEREVNDASWEIFVQRETKTRNLLTSAGWDRSFFDKDHGNQRDLSLCPFVSDLCLIHSTKELCLADSFCGWSNSKELCLGLVSNIQTGYQSSVFEPLETKIIPQYYWKDWEKGVITEVEKELYSNAEFTQYQESRSVKQGIEGCKLIIKEPKHLVDLSQGEAVMFYHFLDFILPMIRQFSSETSFSNQLVVQGKFWSMWRDWINLLSNNCPRAISDIPEGTCFLDAQAKSGASPTFNLRNWVYDRLGIKENKLKKPRLGLIMRRNKRFLLNLSELVEEAKDMGVEVVVLPLEDMTLFEQISALSSINILMGIHGSGLTNIRFIPSGGVLVQLHPWLVKDTNTIVQSFYKMAQENDCDFFCWQNKERANTRIHTHFLGKDFIGKEEEALEKELQNTAGDLWLRFWINQDTYFPPQEFREVLQKAIEKIR